ncbi:LytR C-terminal domain-containing protein [Cellulomonas sp. WB94]|uniref:LytR C-terminal domain-containing protein n=1 Tax=Cellulomonas sp. WB94 TaxID=2173174 RepID=UPI001304D8B1|nr:LytR C-terminal domain-containing protein [Cellulomonas sp. WB94]
MSKASYPYPPDEFDAADDHDGPRGVHRSPRTTWSKVWPFLVVLVVFPALAYGLVTWISNSDTGLGGAISGLGATGTTEPTDTATDAATGTATDTAPPADTATSEAPVAPPAATPDLTSPVVVLNAANVSGLAASQTKKLEAGGFTKVTASNGTGTGVKATTVFYATEDQKVTADAVAQLLGISTVELSTTRAKDGITIVLMPGFKG